MLEILNNEKLNQRLFFIGVFLLGSAPSLSGIFLLFSLIFSLINSNIKIFQDRWHIPFLLAGCLLPLFAIIHSSETSELYDKWNTSLSWIGLGNWIPLIASYLGFQRFVKSNKDRKLTSIFLISGSFPVICSGIAQYWFNWYGPFDFLNGFVIWFQKPLLGDTGLSSLFSNQNYAGIWFCMIWPFCLASFLDRENSKQKKVLSLIFLIAITISIVLTTSRSAWICLVLLVPFMLGRYSFLWILFCTLIISSIFYLVSFDPTVSEGITSFIKEYLPDKILREFSTSNFVNRDSRMEIWTQAINLINQRPLVGWGAATFPILYASPTGTIITHTHNLILELAVSYGSIVTILIFFPILLILILSYMEIYNNKLPQKQLLYQKAWYSSFFCLMFSQLLDVQYFDVRISLMFWILLAGLKQSLTNFESKVTVSS